MTGKLKWIGKAGKLKVDHVFMAGDWEAENKWWRQPSCRLSFSSTAHSSPRPKNETGLGKSKWTLHLWQMTGNLKVDGSTTLVPCVYSMNGASLSTTVGDRETESGLGNQKWTCFFFSISTLEPRVE